MSEPTSFYDHAKQIVLSRSLDNDAKLGQYLRDTNSIFTDTHFHQLTSGLRHPKGKALLEAKSEFERGWKDGQMERAQTESIMQAAFARRMEEQTIQAISRERQRIAKALLK